LCFQILQGVYLGFEPSRPNGGPLAVGDNKPVVGGLAAFYVCVDKERDGITFWVIFFNGAWISNVANPSPLESKKGSCTFI